MKVLVTGAAGFIGSKLMELLAKRGDTVTGIDNINTYYNPNLKYARLAETGIELPPDCPLNKAVPETGNDGTEVTFPEMPFGMKIPSTKIPRLRFIRMDIVDIIGKCFTVNLTSKLIFFLHYFFQFINSIFTPFFFVDKGQRGCHIRGARWRAPQPGARSRPQGYRPRTRREGRSGPRGGRRVGHRLLQGHRVWRPLPGGTYGTSS